MIKTYLKIFAGDVLGSLNSAIVALPQALAFGVATGFGASAGVWGAIILCFIAGLLGSKVPLVSGITGPVTIVIASIMAALNADISSVILVIFMAGILGNSIINLASGNRKICSLSCNFRFYEWYRSDYNYYAD